MTRPLPADAPRRKLGRPPAPKKVFMKFYTADWRADLDLRSCSFAARGLWMDMLSMMAEAEPYGHLVVSGRPITTRQLARLLAGDEAEVKGLLAELDAAGVFSRTEEGVIYSRRMVRDAEKSEEGKQLIARRWGKRDDERPQLRVVGGG